MYIQSITISKKGWDSPKPGETIEYKGTIKFKDGEQEFTFVLNDDTTRILTMCVMDRVKDTADTFTDKIKAMMIDKPKTVPDFSDIS